jgi:isopentenyl-diphosphate Delta-isomerase
VSRAKRKLEHIDYALSTGQMRAHGLKDVLFVHQSLPDIGVDDVCLHTSLGELKLSSPIFINAMTGGGGKQTEDINRSFAKAAKHYKMAMSVGSQMAAVKDPKQRYSYEVVRKENPDGIIFGNLGSEATVEQAKIAVDMIGADGLQIHLNVIQELVMPEGDRDFKGALARIEDIKESLNIPIIIKEVGFGISKETAQKLVNIGVDVIDVGGFGGTNFSKIENERRLQQLAYFDDWGISTVCSTAEISSHFPFVPLVASGGLQNGLDGAKVLSLGGDVAGFAGHLLKQLVNHGEEGLFQEIDQLHEDVKMIMTSLGVTTLKELQRVPLIIKGDSYHWLNERGIDTKRFSQRRGLL